MADDNSVIIDFLARDAGLQNAVKNVTETLQGLKRQIDSVGDAAKDMLVTGIAGYSINAFIKAAAEEEEGVHALHMAMEANGAAMEVWGDHMDGLIDQLQRVTTHSDDAIRSFMKMALNRGVVVQDLENMTKAAMGLSRITGMGLTVSLRQLQMAQEGAFGALNRVLPQMRNLSSDAEKLAYLNDKIAKGWDQETQAMNTAAGMQRKLHQSLDDLKEDLGQALLPDLLKFVETTRTIVLVIRDWVGKNEELVGSIIRWSVTILSTLVFLPKIISLFTWLGSTMVWLATSPIGLMILGFTALFAIISNTSASGATFWERMKNGASELVNWIDALLGSWKNFSQGMQDIWNIVWSSFKSGWEEAYHSIKTLTIELKGWLEQVWADVGGNIRATMEYISDMASIAMHKTIDPFYDKAAEQQDKRTAEEHFRANQGIYKKQEEFRVKATAEERQKKEKLEEELNIQLGALQTAPANIKDIIRRNINEKRTELIALEKEVGSREVGQEIAGLLGAEENRHKKAKGDLGQELEESLDKFRQNSNEREEGGWFTGPDKLSGNVKKLLKDSGMGPIWEETMKSFSDLKKSVLGGAGGAPGALELGSGAGKDFKASFEDAEASYKRMATYFASGEDDPARKTADNTKQQVDLMKEQQEKSSKAAEKVINNLENIGKALMNMVKPQPIPITK